MVATMSSANPLIWPCSTPTWPMGHTRVKKVYITTERQEGGHLGVSYQWILISTIHYFKGSRSIHYSLFTIHYFIHPRVPSLRQMKQNKTHYRSVFVISIALCALGNKIRTHNILFMTTIVIYIHNNLANNYLEYNLYYIICAVRLQAHTHTPHFWTP